MERLNEMIFRVNKGGDLNASSDQPQYASVKSLYRNITSNKKLNDITISYRNTDDKEERKRWKRYLLPSVEFNSVCEGTRCISNVSRMTGFIVVDIDDLDTFEQAARVRDNIFADPRLGCVLAFVSIGGNGVKAVLDVGDGKVTVENVKDWYEAVSYYVKSTYGIPIDTNACDAVRLCYLAYDPDAKVAPDDRENGFSIDASWATLARERKERIAVARKESTAGRTFVCRVEEGQIASLLKSFAGLCDSYRMSYLDDYNTWLGFGANCHRVFGGSTEGMEVWDACSRHSRKYNRRDLVEKWGQLPDGNGDITVIGMLYNFAKNSYTFNLRTWLHITMSKLGMFTTITVYGDESPDTVLSVPESVPSCTVRKTGDELAREALELCDYGFCLYDFRKALKTIKGYSLGKSRVLQCIDQLVREGRIVRQKGCDELFLKTQR